MNDININQHVNYFKDDLLFALSLNIENKLNAQNDNIIYELEDSLATVKAIINDLDDTEDIATICKYIKLAEKLITSFYDKINTETLVKKQFYITKAQLSFLDEYGEKNNLGGKGKRSLALRNILNNVMNK